MTGGAMMQVAVSVAAVWTSPQSPRKADSPALQNPADIEGWLGALTVQDRLDLCDANRVQTQALFGAQVLVIEEQGDWAHVCIPDQSTPKNALGYPGWIPMRQLAACQDRQPAASYAVVVSPRATLSFASSRMTVSYMTRLPVLEEGVVVVRVATPVGEGVAERKDVRIVPASGEPASSAGPETAERGKRIVREAHRFIGLPYLWGGMSSFGFDCSGFAYQMHRSQDIVIPRDASAQAGCGKPVPRDRPEPGDLLFFARDEGKGPIHHVGIYAGDGMMIHSPDSRGAVEKIRLAEHKLAASHCLSVRYW